MSDWRKAGVARRDTRQDKSPVRPLSGSSRDTKRWCRGKVGVEHKAKCVDYKSTKRIHAGHTESFAKGWKLLVCTVCGKELRTWMPWGKQEPPAWAVESTDGDKA